MKRPGSLAVRLVLVAALATGCGSDGFTGLYNLTLPGGADLGTHPYRVTVHFRDVLDLVPQSGVKVNDVAVGRVERIELAENGRIAQVTVVVNGEVRLPANALARLRQSSILGEKFVELAAPSAAASPERLADGAVVPVERTNRNPELEEVFGALSLLLNGGGLAQVQEIAKELNNALSGNEKDVKELLGNLNTFVGGLDAHRGEITRALDGLGKLSTTLAARSAQFGGVLDELGPGLEVLNQQRTSMVTMLKSLDKLSAIAVDVVTKTKDDLIADLRALEPTLRKLAEAGQQLPKALELLFTFPFPDAALDAIKGDYLNTFVRLNPHTKGPGPTDGGR